MDSELIDKAIFSKPTNNAVLLALIGLALCYLAFARLRNRNPKTGVNPPPTAPTFQTPLPLPFNDASPTTSAPHPYRPFQHGPNHITMGIRKLDWNDWIEMDANFLPYHATKVAELEKDLPAHVQCADDERTRDACYETLEELVRFLTHRYPKVFWLDGGRLGNEATGEVFSWPAGSPTEALVVAAKLVQDDVILMVERDDGQFHLDAGAVCLPGFWRLREKFGLSLDELHFEAGVPHYEQKLRKSMNRFFKSMTPEKAVTRNNFFIQIDDGLHWSHRMGDQNGDEVASWATADSADLKLEEIYFRSERQTLRRLPRSGALMFTVRTYFEPVTVIAKEPHVPGRLAEAIRQWDETVSVYKGKKHWEHLLLPYLDEQHRLQVENDVLQEHVEREFPY
ncbi:hypothetical protein GTA08_BOTSDO06176 [Botryosphaeria dothidea]|uniref:Mannosyl transferase protein n=1 Tax=Botryosphaeria dothidea TaxID=55169 RepID=A0A8H4IQN7_9PEZI|nr:hypothetical protein GTA08_BOTSDO06176 [Botryosphaeria dothidea]